MRKYSHITSCKQMSREIKHEDMTVLVLREPKPTRTKSLPTDHPPIGDRNELETLILNIAKSYINRRKEQGFAEYAEKDLVKLMDKMYIRYFEHIEKEFWPVTNPTPRGF